MKKLLILIAVLGIIVFTTVYAEQQVSVPLPFDRPFVSHQCQTFFANSADSVKLRAVVNCYWVWEYDSEIGPDVKKMIPETGTVPNGDLPPGVIDLINKNPPPKPADETTTPGTSGAGGDDRIDTYKEEVAAVAKLAECYRGYDASHEWGAFVDTQLVPYWMNSTREQFADRDSLSSRQTEISPDLKIPLLPVLKAIEECIAIQKYVFLGMIGPEEALKAVHDHLNIGKDNLPIPTIRANEGKTPLNTPDALNQKLLDEAQRAREFVCLPQNQARHLCQPYGAFTGVNRGISQAIISRDVVVNVPNYSMSGKTAVDIYGMYKLSKAERDLTAGDTAKYMAEINQITCDNYFITYKHKLGTEDFPEWLNTACMQGTKSTQYDLMKRHALEP